MNSLFVQVLQDVETASNATDEHPLALLAEQTKNLLKKETANFSPILSQRHPQAIVVSASLLHKLYGIKLVSIYSQLLSVWSVYIMHKGLSWRVCLIKKKEG